MSRLLRKTEAAALLGVPENTLTYWVQTNYAPPSAKIGRHRVWREADCLAWIDAQFAKTAGG
jgi:predicted DNA-binding transcriptional regulator AlpA